MMTATKPMQKVRGWKGNAVNKETGFQSSGGEGKSECVEEDDNKKPVAGAGRNGQGE